MKWCILEYKSDISYVGYWQENTNQVRIKFWSDYFWVMPLELGVNKKFVVSAVILLKWCIYKFDIWENVNLLED